MEGDQPIVLVDHEGEGRWLFLSSGEAEEADVGAACLGCLVALDPSLNELADLPVGWRAWRDHGIASWNRSSLAFHDRSTVASDPGGVKLSVDRLYAIWPEKPEGSLSRMFRWRERFEIMLDEHLRLGDSRAAVVVFDDPLIIAAYTDDMDCVALLRFPNALAAEHTLSVGSRLLTVNTYFTWGLARDLQVGNRGTSRYVNFHPVIADFLSNDIGRIATRKRQIAEDEWERCSTMGTQRLAEAPNAIRDGSPRRSGIPAS